MTLNLEKSAAAFAEAKKVIPGGVNSPVRSFRSAGGTPPFIAKASGSHIYDIDGNDYIDDLLIHEQYDQATTFIHSQLKRLTTNDYNLLVSVYIEYLENLPPVIRQKHHFDDRKIASLREKLSEFSW